MYFRLNPECYFVKGKKHGAIYDLIENKIYALNQQETELAVSFERNLPVSEDDEFPRDLKRFLLGNFYNNGVYIHKMRFNNEATEQLLERTPNLDRAFLEINNSCKRDCWFCGWYGIRRSLGCLGCNKWNEDSKPLEVNRWKKLVDELRDLDCKNIIITGGDLTLEWDKTVEILDYAEDKFSSIYIILHQESLSKTHISDLDGRTKPIIQTENLSNNVIQDGSFPLLIVKPDHWRNVDNLIGKNKNIMMDFVIKDGCLVNDLPMASKKKIMMPRMYKFLHNMRFHPCIGNTLAITYTGNILPCPMMRGRNFGNIRCRELYTVFEKYGRNEINRFWKLTLDNIDKCNICEFRYSCGDCRALEESLTGKLGGKMLCSYDPKEGVWL